MDCIVNVTQNWGIGKDGGLLVSISADLRRFRALTTGKTVIYGRKTLLTFPHTRPLPNRENAVLTSHPETVGEGARAFATLDGLLAAYADDSRDLWIIGGAHLYETALDRCQELIISRVKASPKGDVFFPKFDDKFRQSEIILSRPEFDVVRYVRK